MEKSIGLIVAFLALAGTARADVAPPFPISLDWPPRAWTFPVAIAISLAIGLAGVKMARDGGGKKVLFAGWVCAGLLMFIAGIVVIESNSSWSAQEKRLEIRLRVKNELAERERKQAQTLSIAVSVVAFNIEGGFSSGVPWGAFAAEAAVPVNSRKPERE